MEMDYITYLNIMWKAKDIIVKPIQSKYANEFIKNNHYSGKVVQNSTLHFGVFLPDNKLHGVMSYGNSLDKSKIINLVKNTGWNNFIELNRMAFDETLPIHSESRAISVSIKLIKKHYPHIKWIISFADGTQCGDGTIYRASGFILTKIKRNSDLYIISELNSQSIQDLKNENITDYQIEILKKFIKSGIVIHTMSVKTSGKEIQTIFRIITSGGTSVKKFFEILNAKQLDGYQLRYIYLIDKTCELNCDNIPYKEIDNLNAGMYKGNKVSIQERKSVINIDSDVISNQK
jgi:hypothetical protein